MKTKVGSQRIPITRLLTLLKDSDTLNGIHGTSAFSIEEMILDLKSNPNSSSIPTKIPDFKQFELLEGHYGGFRITGLAQDVLQQDSAQRSISLNNVVRKIKLWDVFQNNGGKDIADDTVIKLLIQETGVKESEARGRVDEIKSAFIQDVKCITDFKPKQRPKLILRKPQNEEQKEPELTVEASTNETPYRELDVVATSFESTKKEDEIVDNESAKLQGDEASEPLEEAKITVISQDLIGLAEYLPSTEKVTFEFGKVKFELRDESSIALAKVLIKVKERGLQRS